MTEKYLCIYPSGEISWVNIDRVPYTWTDGDGIDLKQCYSIIGCSCIEQVRTVLPGIVLLVDESGRVKDPPQHHNEIASHLYAGFLLGLDDIVGPAIVCALRPVEPLGEMDLFPLSSSDLYRLTITLDIDIEEDAGNA